MALSYALKAAPVGLLSDYQRDWNSVIKPLKKGGYCVEDLESRSIHGDAPKNFIKVKEYRQGKLGRSRRDWTGYIAKVGYKNYPNESITEQLLTRVGQESGVKIAGSMLRTVAGQVRFFSKYFLNQRRESLTHRIQIFKHHIKDDEFVQEISLRSRTGILLIPNGTGGDARVLP